jgi:hypothetical protein
LSLSSSEVLRYWQGKIDFFALPAVQLFEGVGHLMNLLLEAGRIGDF